MYPQEHGITHITFHIVCNTFARDIPTALFGGRKDNGSAVACHMMWCQFFITLSFWVYVVFKVIIC